MHYSRQSRHVLQLYVRLVLQNCKTSESAEEYGTTQWSLESLSRYGLAGSSNTTGDDQKKLDVLANDLFINMLKSSYTVYAMASEENEQFIEVEVPKQVGKISIKVLGWFIGGHRANILSVLIRWMVHQISIVSWRKLNFSYCRSNWSFVLVSVRSLVFGRNLIMLIHPWNVFYRVVNIYDVLDMRFMDPPVCSS